jgi:hypothetical protein|tara:strand:- start:400 stop:1221 length:822 start_codon:yes stop_codon:yes gene_type:complete
MKIKHNKKRNTAFLYEVIIREATKAVVQKNSELKNQLIHLLKEHFDKNTELGKDLSLYRTLYEIHGLTPNSAEKLIHEVKKEHSKIDKKVLFNEQSALIKKINKLFSKSIFSNFVPNYKNLATVYQIFSEDTPLQKRVLLEQDLFGRMLKRTDKRQDQLKPVNNLIFKTFAKKFNKKYSSELLEEQKSLLQKYLHSFADNGVELKIFLNEEVGRLKKAVLDSLKAQDIVDDSEMVKKTKKVLKMLENFRNEKVDKNLINKIYKIQNLVKEIKD